MQPQTTATTDVWNPMWLIREKVFDMGHTKQEIEEFLEMWATLSREEARELRTRDLSGG